MIQLFNSLLGNGNIPFNSFVFIEVEKLWHPVPVMIIFHQLPQEVNRDYNCRFWLLNARLAWLVGNSCFQRSSTEKFFCNEIIQNFDKDIKSKIIKSKYLTKLKDTNTVQLHKILFCFHFMFTAEAACWYSHCPWCCCLTAWAAAL